MLIQTLMRVEWMTVPAEKTLEHIVARLSNRVFVGYPLCTFPCLNSQGLQSKHLPGRKREFLDLSIEFTIDVVKDRTILVLFPRFLRS